MLDFNSKTIMNFCNTFSLKITREGRTSYDLVDPWGVEYTVANNGHTISTDFSKKRLGGYVLPTDKKLFTHIMSSFEEFADYWSPDNVQTCLMYKTSREGSKSLGSIEIQMDSDYNIVTSR